MSAVVLFYTRSGFVIAADGRSAFMDQDQIEIETDEAQKIFCVTTNGYALAYAVSGRLIANQGRSFDLVAECNERVRILAIQHPNSIPLFLDSLGRALKRYVGRAIKTRLIELPPLKANRRTYRELLTSVDFAGYANDLPQWTAVKLFQAKSGLVLNAVEDPIPIPLTGKDQAYGSMAIPDHVKSGQYPELSKYHDAFKLNSGAATLNEAVEYARAYIGACSEPIAKDLDPICNGIGGHIHICVVTPEGGFRWIVPPKYQNQISALPSS